MNVQRVFFRADLTFEDVSSVLFRELQEYFLLTQYAGRLLSHNIHSYCSLPVANPAKNDYIYITIKPTTV